MTWTLPARFCYHIRISKSNRVILSAICAGDFRQHNVSGFYSPLSSGYYGKVHHSSMPQRIASDLNATGHSCSPWENRVAGANVTLVQQEAPSPIKTFASTIHVNNNSISGKPCLSNSLTAASLVKNSLFTLPRSYYHQSSNFHSHFNGKLGRRTSLGSRLNISHHPLLSQKDVSQSSHPSMSSFSTTRLILEASPSTFQPYLRLIRFDKPIGTWLLYWPCTWSIALAGQPGCMPDLKILALFGAGSFFMRGAGCIINDMWDKDIDAKVERTRTRPLASGEITQFQALVFLGTQLSCALAILLQLNFYSIILGASSMGLVILYPLAKRFTYWPQLMLGLTLNWGVLLAWSTLRGSVELPGLILYSACTLYTIIYDTIYSHQDKYDDMLIGVKSTAIALGEQTKPWLSVFTAIMTGGLLTSGHLCDMTWPYFAAVGLTSARLAQQIYSVDLNNADQCANAFSGNFYLGAIMFLGIVLSNYLKSKEQEESTQGKSTVDTDDAVTY